MKKIIGWTMLLLLCNAFAYTLAFYPDLWVEKNLNKFYIVAIVITTGVPLLNVSLKLIMSDNVK